MKTFVKFVTICLLISFLAACGGAPAAQEPDAQEPAAPTEQEPAAPADTTSSEPEMTTAEQWAMENGVGPYTPESEDWAAIEAAAIEEGSVVVYSNSSKIEKLLEPWNALYPDIELAGGDTDDISVKMGAEQQAGNVVGDVWFNSDGHILYGEFVPNQWIWWYTPPAWSLKMPLLNNRLPWRAAPWMSLGITMRLTRMGARSTTGGNSLNRNLRENSIWRIPCPIPVPLPKSPCL